MHCPWQIKEKERVYSAQEDVCRLGLMFKVWNDQQNDDLVSPIEDYKLSQDRVIYLIIVVFLIH